MTGVCEGGGGGGLILHWLFILSLVHRISIVFSFLTNPAETYLSKPCKVPYKTELNKYKFIRKIRIAYKLLRITEDQNPGFFFLT